MLFTETARALGSLAPFEMEEAARANFRATAAAATLRAALRDGGRVGARAVRERGA